MTSYFMGQRIRPANFFLRRLIDRTSTDYFDPVTLERLLELMNDHDDSNRDWATFFVATSKNVGGGIEPMLLENAYDGHPSISAEAVLGLAKRRHPRALRLVKKALDRKSIGSLDIKAAGYLANRTLLSRLRRIEKWWDGEDTYLKAAIKACTNNGKDDYNFD